MRNALWFRNDLRIHDNPALVAATNGDTNTEVLAFYIFTPEQHRAHGVGNSRLRFILEQVASLSQELAAIGIPLLVSKSCDYQDSVKELMKLVQQHRISRVFANSEVELNERTRDQSAHQRLHKAGIVLQLFNDQTLLDPGTVETDKGLPYRVFTPFKRAWLKKIKELPLQPLPPPKKRERSQTKATEPAEFLNQVAPQVSNQYWQAGSKEASRRLQKFLAQGIESYAEQRDFPGLDGTSQLSPYLSVGAISPRTCLHQALQANGFEWDSGSEGIRCWINELIWREFYKHLSYQFPSVCKGAAFQGRTEHIRWHQDPQLLAAWQQGKTGYPLVDAGMRQLDEMGWMHNRLRMVTAMFLSKHLFLNWRLGEAYFMDKLIDADFSANNGGWQWSASTGADAAPYFRIFNPQRQADRFDKNGDFIRQWVPELRDMTGSQIHNPNPMERQMLGYPDPVVDHREAVERTKQAFQEASAMEAV